MTGLIGAKRMVLRVADFDQRDALHHQNAEQGAKKAEQKRRKVVGVGEGPEVADREEELVSDKETRDDDTRECRDNDRRERGNRIGADDEFEAVEGPGERRVEGRGDRCRRAATDQRSQIVAARLEGEPKPRSDPRRYLRIAGLEANRCAEPVRYDVLHDHKQAVGE